MPPDTPNKQVSSRSTPGCNRCHSSRSLCTGYAQAYAQRLSQSGIDIWEDIRRRQNGRVSASIANAVHAAMLRALRRDRDLASGTAGHFSNLVPPLSYWLIMRGNRANLWSRVGTLSALAMPTLGERASRTTILPALRSAGNPTALKGSCDARSPRPHSDLSIFQKIGVAGPSSTPVSDLRQALGARYWPSGM